VTAALATGRDRWSGLSASNRGALSVLGASLAVFVVYRIPGVGPFLGDKAPFGIVVAGVIVGTVTALLAMGLILIYKTSRFINFAYASMGSLAGVTAIGLHLEKGVPFFAALPIGVAIGVLTGALVELVVRRFRHTSRLILTVASIGIAQILSVIEAAIAFRGLGFVSLTGGFKIPLDLQLDLGVKTLFGDEILIMLVIPPVLAGLAWFLLRTDVGVAVRAAAENEDRALLLGIPIRRLSTIVWMVAGGLAALTFVLKAPFSGVTPGLASAGPLLLLPALAAAVVARMESLPVAFVAGIGLGVMEAIIGWNTPGSPTVQYVAFLVVILAALLLQSGKLSRAQEGATSTWSSLGVVKPIPVELRHLPEVAWAKRVLIGLVVLAFVFIPAGWSPSNQYLAAVAIVWALAAVSLVILTGWGGHISLGQFAIVGVGALVAGNLIQHWNLDLFLVLIRRPAGPAHPRPLPRRHDARLRGGARPVRPQLQQLPRPHPHGGRPPDAPRALRPDPGPHDVRHVPRVPRPRRARRAGAAQGPRRARDDRHPRQPARRRRRRRAHHQREARRLPRGRRDLRRGRWPPRGHRVVAQPGHLPAIRLAHRVRHERDRWPRVDLGSRARGAPVPLHRDDDVPRRRARARQHPPAAHRRDAAHRPARPAGRTRPAPVRRSTPARSTPQTRWACSRARSAVPPTRSTSTPRRRRPTTPPSSSPREPADGRIHERRVVVQRHVPQAPGAAPAHPADREQQRAPAR
jgi:branched-subunit amino acid ABC-type transport system permease component